MTMDKEHKRSFFWRKSHSQQHLDTPGAVHDGGVMSTSSTDLNNIEFKADQGSEFTPQDVNLSSLFMPFIKNYVSNLSHNKSPTKLPYPPSFYYPASSLQHQMNLQMCHIDLLLRANTLPTPQERFIAVLRYSLSTCSLTKFPYKPIIAFLGETAQSTAVTTDGVTSDTTYYLGEQVEKDPSGCAFYISNPARGVVHEGSVAMIPKFKQAHVHVEFEGQRRTILTSQQGGWNEVYTGTVPDLNIRLLRMHTELGGEFTLTCPTTGYSAVIQFKDKPIFGGAKNALGGKITFQGRDIFHIDGTWDEVSYLVDPVSKARFELFNRLATPKLKVESLPLEHQLPTSGEREWGPLLDSLHRRDFEQSKIIKAQVDVAHHERQAKFEAAGGFVPSVFARGQDNSFYIKNPALALASSGNPTM